MRGAKSAEAVADYLPSNYKVLYEDSNGQGILIGGEDDHGWTLDDYVIPRLGSGLMVAQEASPVFLGDNINHAYHMNVPKDWLEVKS